MLLALLRTAKRLQACLLLLFVCSVGVAVASPLVAAKAGSPMSVVCSGQAGVKLAGGSPDEGATRLPQPVHKLDCPLCLPLGVAASPEIAVATLGAPADAPGVGGPDTVRTSPRALRPPARAPPFDPS